MLRGLTESLKDAKCTTCGRMYAVECREYNAMGAYVECLCATAELRALYAKTLECLSANKTDLLLEFLRDIVKLELLWTKESAAAKLLASVQQDPTD